MPEQTFHTPLPLTLDVSIPAGDIEVETVEGDQSTVEVSGDDSLLENLEVRQDGDRLVVALRGKSKFGFVVAFGSQVFGNAGLRVQARVPHGSGVKVKTASADLDIEGQIAELDVNSTSGDVRARGVIAGDANVKIVSGDVELDRLGGDLSVQSVSGDLRVGAAGGSVDTKSVSGDIRLEAVSAGEAHFTSVSGDIEIGIAQGSFLDVDAGSTSGDLSSEVPLASAPGGEGEDGPTVVLRGKTISGDVRVFRAS
ncbi:MAG TPA: DUF4097 family beta strand repeat-containing protein [Gaiellaceae bacterium]|nr:DUF4097 family beta strand repeat-containing protein [Gaiellaceae bacterium]